MYDQAKLTAAVITAPHVALRAPLRRGTSKPPRIQVGNAFQLGMFLAINSRARRGNVYLPLRPVSNSDSLRETIRLRFGAATQGGLMKRPCGEPPSRHRCSHHPMSDYRVPDSACEGAPEPRGERFGCRFASRRGKGPMLASPDSPAGSPRRRPRVDGRRMTPHRPIPRRIGTDHARR